MCCAVGRECWKLGVGVTDGGKWGVAVLWERKVTAGVREMRMRGNECWETGCGAIGKEIGIHF